MKLLVPGLLPPALPAMTTRVKRNLGFVFWSSAKMRFWGFVFFKCKWRIWAPPQSRQQIRFSCCPRICCSSQCPGTTRSRKALNFGYFIQLQNYQEQKSVSKNLYSCISKSDTKSGNLRPLPPGILWGRPGPSMTWEIIFVRFLKTVSPWSERFQIS